MELCLGTVQQGLEYGINNLYGKPTTETSLEIFHIAVESGIRVFDTARAYGNAELLIGEYFKKYGNPHNIRVISKLRPNVITDENRCYEIMLEECQKSIERLGVSKLYGYLFHTPEYIRNPKFVDALVKLKETGLVENIGVSIYEIEDGEIAIDTKVVDFIQLPLSVFDQRGITTGFLKRAKQAGITIFTRSAFLQGLLYMKGDDVPDKVIEAKSLLCQFNELVEKSNYCKTEVLIGFVKNIEYIDYLVFGVDTKEQLKEDIEIFHNVCLDSSLCQRIQSEYLNISKAIIFPSLWSDGKTAE